MTRRGTPGGSRIELHHGKIAHEVFSMADEEQLDEVLEELGVLASMARCEVERMESHGALPVQLGN